MEKKEIENQENETKEVRSVRSDHSRSAVSPLKNVFWFGFIFILIAIALGELGHWMKRIDANNAFNRGLAAQKQGNYDDAIREYSVAINLGPSNSAAYSIRAVALVSKGDLDAAILDYIKAIRLNPKDSSSYFNRGNAFVGKGNLEAAIRDFTEAIRLDPSNPSPYSNIAWLHATCPDDKLRDGTKAVEFATEACELSGWQQLNCISILAAAYAEAGDWDNAVKRQQEAIEMTTGENEQDVGQDRLELYRNHKPYREQPKDNRGE